MNTAPAASASQRAQGAGFAAVLTLAMLLGINTLATQADARAEAQMAAAAATLHAAQAHKAPQQG